jgi:UDP-GlcNAc:undecaprenyl-phosphate GlcNAc-1-phosphate transferase
VLIRLRQGRSPFHADKQHLSHRLVDAGLSPPAAVGVIDLLALASGTGGLVLSEAPTWAVAGLAGVQLVCWWVAVAAVDYGLRRRR